MTAPPPPAFAPPPFRSDFLDGTGKVSREWFVWLSAVYRLLGGTIGPGAPVSNPAGDALVLALPGLARQDLQDLKLAVEQAQQLAYVALSTATGNVEAGLNIMAGLGIQVDVAAGVITITNLGVLNVLEADGTVSVDNSLAQHPALSVNQPMLNLNLLGGHPLLPARGGTGLTTLGSRLQHLRTNSAATALEHAGPVTVDVRFNFGDASPKPIFLVAAHTLIKSVRIALTTALNGVGSSLGVGDAGNYQRLMTFAQNFADEVATYETNPGLGYAINTQLLLTIIPGVGCTQGSGVVSLDLES